MATKIKQNVDVKEYLNEKIPVHLHKDSNEYKDSLPVTVNGETMMIPRGETVMVPRKFVLNIEQSALQNSIALNYMDNLKRNNKSAE